MCFQPHFVPLLLLTFFLTSTVFGCTWKCALNNSVLPLVVVVLPLLSQYSRGQWKNHWWGIKRFSTNALTSQNSKMRMQMQQSPATIIFVIIFQSLLVTDAIYYAPVVRVRSGRVRGEVHTIPYSTPVYAYKGIPYGKKGREGKNPQTVQN